MGACFSCSILQHHTERPRSLSWVTSAAAPTFDYCRRDLCQTPILQHRLPDLIFKCSATVKLITGPSYYYGSWTNLVLQEACVNVSCTLATASISNKRERRNATSPAARRCLRRIIRRPVLTPFLTSKASERFLPTLPSPICRIPLFPSSSSTFLTNRFKIFEASNPTAPLAIALGPQKDPAYMPISGRPL